MEKIHCLWCHSYHDIMYEKIVLRISRLGIPKGEEIEFFCSDDCFNKADKFLKSCAKYFFPFLILLTLVLIGIFRSTWFARNLGISNEYFLAILLFPVGLFLEFVPFTTQETIHYFGLKKGSWMTRIIGLALIGLSIILIVWNKVTNM